LEAAGYVFTKRGPHDITCPCNVYERKERLDGFAADSAVVYDDETVVCLELYVPAERVPSILSPLATERVEAAVRHAFDPANPDAQLLITSAEVEAVVASVLAYLAKEVQ
jgi:hypothetical protein